MNVPSCSEVARMAVNAASCVKLSLTQVFSAGRLWIIFLTPLWSTWVYSPLPGIAWLLVSVKRELAPKLCAAKNSRIVFTRGGRSHRE
jgi:hypothetical protein